MQNFLDTVYGKQVLEDVMAERTKITVYRVGILQDLHILRMDLRPSPIRVSRIRHRLRWIAHSWRRRSYWNGFLAEVDYPPAGLNHTRCGKGWTRKRAARDLGLQLWKDNQ